MFINNSQRRESIRSLTSSFCVILIMRETSATIEQAGQQPVGEPLAGKRQVFPPILTSLIKLLAPAGATTSLVAQVFVRRASTGLLADRVGLLQNKRTLRKFIFCGHRLLYCFF